MLKHGKREGSNNCWKTENYKGNEWGMSILEISEQFCGHHWMIKKVVNITNLSAQSKEKGFKNLISWDWRNLKQDSGITIFDQCSDLLKGWNWGKSQRTKGSEYFVN